MSNTNWFVSVVVVNEFAAVVAASSKDKNVRNQLMALSKECEMIWNKGLSQYDVDDSTFRAISTVYLKANEDYRGQEIITRTVQALNNL